MTKGTIGAFSFILLTVKDSGLLIFVTNCDNFPPLRALKILAPFLLVLWFGKESVCTRRSHKVGWQVMYVYKTTTTRTRIPNKFVPNIILTKGFGI